MCFICTVYHAFMFLGNPLIDILTGFFHINLQKRGQKMFDDILKYLSHHILVQLYMYLFDHE